MVGGTTGGGASMTGVPSMHLLPKKKRDACYYINKIKYSFLIDTILFLGLKRWVGDGELLYLLYKL